MRREGPRARRRSRRARTAAVRRRSWRIMKKQRSPGPAAYNIKSTVCSDAPAYSFGTMKRPAPNFKGISPGPVYQLKASLGRNRDITFKALPAFGFGTSERPDPGGGSALRELRRACPPARARPVCTCGIRGRASVFVCVAPDAAHSLPRAAVSCGPQRGVSVSPVTRTAPRCIPVGSLARQSHRGLRQTQPLPPFPFLSLCMCVEQTDRQGLASTRSATRWAR